MLMLEMYVMFSVLCQMSGGPPAAHTYVVVDSITPVFGSDNIDQTVTATWDRYSNEELRSGPTVRRCYETGRGGGSCPSLQCCAMLIITVDCRWCLSRQILVS